MLISSMLHSTSTEFVLQLYHLHNRITPQKILQFKNLTIFILQLLILILNVMSVTTVIATISWPSIIRHLLSNENAQQIYVINIWQLLSLKFRRWQLHLVEEFTPFLTNNGNIRILMIHMLFSTIISGYKTSLQKLKVKILVTLWTHLTSI